MDSDWIFAGTTTAAVAILRIGMSFHQAWILSLFVLMFVPWCLVKSQHARFLSWFLGWTMVWFWAVVRYLVFQPTNGERPSHFRPI